MGPAGETFFCYQGSLKKVENIYDEYELKQEELRKQAEEKRRKKKEKRKKELENQPPGFMNTKKKKRRKKKKKKKMGLIKILPEQGRFTLFTKHPCYLYLREWMNSISNEDNEQISQALKIFLKDCFMGGYFQWFDNRNALEDQIKAQGRSAVFEKLHKSHNHDFKLRQIVHSKNTRII